MFAELRHYNSYLPEEVAKGNILMPFMPGTFHSLHVNCFGVIYKKHQLGKWKLITDLPN